jgi:hypothetical protein
MNVEYLLDKHFYPYDKLVKDQIGVYMDFTRFWIEQLTEMGQVHRALAVLANEWTFCKNNFHYVSCSEDLFAGRFSSMLSYMNEQLFRLLQQVDERYRTQLVSFIDERLKEKQIDRAGSFAFNLKCSQLIEELNQLGRIYMDTFQLCASIIYDIEIVAKYRVRSSLQVLLDKLRENGYIKIEFKTRSKMTRKRRKSSSSSNTSPFMVFIPQEYIKVRLNF